MPGPDILTVGKYVQHSGANGSRTADDEDSDSESLPGDGQQGQRSGGGRRAWRTAKLGG